MVPCPNTTAENGHLSKLIQTGIVHVGTLRIDLGLLSIRVLCFSKLDENDRVMLLNAKRVARNRSHGVKTTLIWS